MHIQLEIVRCMATRTRTKTIIARIVDFFVDSDAIVKNGRHIEFFRWRTFFEESTMPEKYVCQIYASLTARFFSYFDIICCTITPLKLFTTHDCAF